MTDLDKNDVEMRTKAEGHFYSNQHVFPAANNYHFSVSHHPKKFRFSGLKGFLAFLDHFPITAPTISALVL